MHKNIICFSFLKKSLAFLIAAVMLLSLFSVTAFAETADKQIVQTESKVKAKKVSLKGAVIAEISDYQYTGSAIEPWLYITLNGRELYEGTDYKVKYRSNIKPGVARVIITGIGNYTGTIKTSFNILYAKNPVVDTRTYDKYEGMFTTEAKAAKAAQVFTPLKIENAKGKVTYMVVFGAPQLTVNKNTGKVTLAKGTKAGTYQIRLMIRVAGDECYKEEVMCRNIKVVVTK